MSGVYTHNIRLTDGQKQKLRSAYRKRKSTTIGLRNEQLSGGPNRILLTFEQHKALSSALKSNRGLRLLLDYEQLVKNKAGGFLKEMLNMIETTIPGVKTFISPIVRNNIAPLLRNRFVPWLKELIDNELDTLIEKDPKGSGLRRRINGKLNSLLNLAHSKNSLPPYRLKRLKSLHN